MPMENPTKTTVEVTSEILVYGKIVVKQNGPYDVTQENNPPPLPNPQCNLGSITSRCSGKESPLGEERSPDLRKQQKSSLHAASHSESGSYYLATTDQIELTASTPLFSKKDFKTNPRRF